MDTVPLATLGKLLGHLLMETIAKYAHLSDDTIAGAFWRRCWIDAICRTTDGRPSGRCCLLSGTARPGQRTTTGDF